MVGSGPEGLCSTPRKMKIPLAPVLHWNNAFNVEYLRNTKKTRKKGNKDII